MKVYQAVPVEAEQYSYLRRYVIAEWLKKHGMRYEFHAGLLWVETYSKGRPDIGDWIVLEPVFGRVRVYTDATFKKKYREVS